MDPEIADRGARARRRGRLVSGVPLARVLAGASSAAAYDNARDLLTWERALPLPDELAVQQLLLTSEAITRLANVYYLVTGGGKPRPPSRDAGDRGP